MSRNCLQTCGDAFGAPAKRHHKYTYRVYVHASSLLDSPGYLYRPRKSFHLTCATSEKLVMVSPTGLTLLPSPKVQVTGSILVVNPNRRATTSNSTSNAVTFGSSI